jgi:hypothetical protein
MMSKKKTISEDLSLPARSEFLLYQTEDEQTRIEVRLENESVWLNQLTLAALFQMSKQNINLHLKNIFIEGELAENRVVKEFLTTAADGKAYPTKFYNLEKRFYQKIRDIYKLAADYDPKAEETLEFFSIVQNKLHFAIFGKTAAELIAERVDAGRPNTGLTSWKGAKVRKGDVSIAKNYLNAEEAVADQLALEQYEIFHQHRLAEQARQESLADDAELKHYLELPSDAYDKIKQAIQDLPERVGYYINLLLISRHLERLGDHATNIADEVIYLVEGEIFRHAEY